MVRSLTIDRRGRETETGKSAHDGSEPNLIPTRYNQAAATTSAPVFASLQSEASAVAWFRVCFERQAADHWRSTDPLVAGCGGDSSGGRVPGKGLGNLTRDSGERRKHGKEFTGGDGGSKAKPSDVVSCYGPNHFDTGAHSSMDSS